MKLSNRCGYAIRALVELGVARAEGIPSLKCREVAARANIPKGFLDHIFLQLREAGVLGSRHGRGGGFFICKPLDSIPIGEIMRLMDGPLAPVGCVSRMRYEPCSCPDESTCSLRLLMLEVRNALNDIVDRRTLADSVNKELKARANRASAQAARVIAAAD